MNEIVLAGTARDVVAPMEGTDDRLVCDAAFFALLSHELRTPLAAVKGFAQGLLLHWEQLPSDKRYEYVEHIMRSSTRLERLVTDLSLASRLVEGVALEPAYLEIGGAVSQAVEEARALHRDRSFSVAVPAGEVQMAYADRHRLLQVLVNLLDNAAKYSPLDDTVMVRWHVGPTQIRIEVCDFGLPLAPDAHEQLFRAFGRAPQPTRGGGSAGTGLGLFICKALVEAMGGAIGIQAAAPSGNVFWFTLPRSRPA